MTTKNKQPVFKPSNIERAAWAILYSVARNGGRAKQKECRLLRACIEGQNKFEGADKAYLDSAQGQRQDELDAEWERENG